MTRRAEPTLTTVIKALASRHGVPPRPTPKSAWDMIVWENVAYLTTDAKREAAFKELRRRIGLDPARILAAPPEQLREVCGGAAGLAARCAEKLRDAADMCIGDFDGDLSKALSLPLAKAKRALQRYPGIGAPGAEKILLFTHTHPCLALESNGLRVLLRLGFGTPLKSYAATYRAVQEAAERTIANTCEARIEAYLLLRLHGQELCRRATAERANCPLGKQCSGLPITA